MNVERIDLFNFKVLLTDSEFKEIKLIADSGNMSIEQTIEQLLLDGIAYEKVE